MTWNQWKEYLAREEPPKVEVPHADLNPDDFIVWTEGEFERALEELEKKEKTRAQIP